MVVVGLLMLNISVKCWELQCSHRRCVIEERFIINIIMMIIININIFIIIIIIIKINFKFRSSDKLCVSGYKMKKRVGAIEEFEFEPLISGGPLQLKTIRSQLHITIAITGWIDSKMPGR